MCFCCFSADFFKVTNLRGFMEILNLGAKSALEMYKKFTHLLMPTRRSFSVLHKRTALYTYISNKFMRSKRFVAFSLFFVSLLKDSSFFRKKNSTKKVVCFWQWRLVASVSYFFLFQRYSQKWSHKSYELCAAAAFPFLDHNNRRKIYNRRSSFAGNFSPTKKYVHMYILACCKRRIINV